MNVPRIAASFALAAVLLAPGSAACDDIIPMQVRLAYAGPKGMIVSWNTYSQLERPMVQYGRSPDALIHEASSDVSVTYPTSTTYNNHVTLEHLEEDTLYYYLPEHSNATEPYTFRTSRRAGDKTPFTMAVVVDMGLMGPDGLSTRVGTGAANPLGPNDTNTIQSIEKHLDGIDFIWHRMSANSPASCTLFKPSVLTIHHEQRVILLTQTTGSRKKSRDISLTRQLPMAIKSTSLF